MRGKRVLSLAFAALIAVAVGVAASGKAPVYGGTVVMATGADAVTMDPLVMTCLPTANVFLHIAETLFDLTPEGEVAPLLATGYAVSPDGLAWTIYLRQGVVFHDGTPFNAEAAKINLDRFRTRATFKFLIEAIAAVEVVDDYTIKLLLTTPFAPLLRGLAHTFPAMLSPASIAAAGEAPIAHPIGTGPFKFVEWVRGDRLVLEKNPNYWGEGPYLDKVVFKPVPEPGTRVMMLLAGEADLITAVPPDDVPIVEADPDTKVIITPALSIQYLGMNTQRPPFNDVRVRRAINYALDKEEILKYIQGGFGRVADAPIGPAVFGYYAAGPYPFDLERARELLTEAGYPDGFKTTLRFNPGWREPAAELIQAQLRKVGIELELITMEWGAYLAFTSLPIAENTTDMFMLGWVSVTGDADYGLLPIFHTTEWPPGMNRSFYSNPDVDRYLSEARIVIDPERRKELYAKAIRIIWDEAAWGFLFVPEHLGGRRINVHGVVHHPDGTIIVTHAWKE